MMTTKDKAFYNHYLATELMGWKLITQDPPLKVNDTWYPDKFFVKDNGNVTHVNRWNPYEDMNQVMDCLAEFRKNNKNWWYCELVSPAPGYYHLRNTTDEFDISNWGDKSYSPSQAICEALYLANESRKK